MSQSPPFSITIDLRAAIDEIGRLRGVPHSAFVDPDWTNGPAGRVDLFRHYTEWSGESISLTETILAGGGILLPIYFVPKPVAGRFVEFLSCVISPLADGSLVAPICLLPGEAPAGMTAEWARQIAQHCHIITPVVYPADDPAVIAKRAEAGNLMDVQGRRRAHQSFN